jgi:hypothetical protein
MPLKSGIYTIIHAAVDADTANYSYNQVYAGANTTATINGVSVNMIGGSTIDILVKTISGTDVYVIGDPKNVIDGPQTLSNYPNP